ncbi:MAG: SAM-dependent DNA methyltransferase, partial [Planctomycetes bacterium]|nr:SAM-dependent DNA methyltransferase [Planctomycetota bacterium]
LGWTYQFWQAHRKNEVNKSGKKIGADEIAPVTQLFTEDYMVEFLLHNTIGAWWAGKMGPIKADTEEEARAQAALPARDGVPGISWTYLRFVQDEKTKTWRPAAGAFDGWPKFARLIRLLDPCMGSGHFLVFALPILVRLRMEEEKLSAQAAVVGVLKDNIHGLEIDERCTQIAAFNVALTAWKLAGYHVLPSLNLACSGLAPSGTESEWVEVAGENALARNGMVRLHSLFKDAPILGSLINPHVLNVAMFEAEFHEMLPMLTAALTLNDSHKAKIENDTIELAVIAQGLAKAAELLSGHFTLVITNVPYLKGGDHGALLKLFCETNYPKSKYDLATVFIERCQKFLSDGAHMAVVTQQYWLFLKYYEGLRESIIRNTEMPLFVSLGPGAFEQISGEVVNVCLQITCQSTPQPNFMMLALEVDTEPSPKEKSSAIQGHALKQLSQRKQLNNPDKRILLDEEEKITAKLSTIADFGKGSVSGDGPHYIRKFWETHRLSNGCKPWLNSPSGVCTWSGREHFLLWGEGNHDPKTEVGFAFRGQRVFGKRGVGIGKAGSLRPTLYSGDLFDDNIAVVCPYKESDLPAIWVFSSSRDFEDSLRRLDKKMSITAGTFIKVPFDLAHWQKVAAEKYPNGLPKPHSDDPTQWLFNGHPAGSTQPLHVAVVRLLGYRWPRQTGSSFPDCSALGPDGLESFSDEDGIVCLPPLSREQPAAARLRQLLTSALGAFDEHALIAAAGLKGGKSKTLEDWLRDEFFAQHIKLFHDRPFIWHLWDGRPDGFHALVSYHKLDHAMLQKLTYSYLGNWIQQQFDDAKADKPGAADRLGAAQTLQAKLAAILEGEAPLDIFVRWKPLKEQARGWHPDMNDGIRQNIRPFLLAGDVGKKSAGLFRAVPLKLKDKDRGKEPHRPKKDYPWFWCEDGPGTDPIGGEEFVGARWNNVHLTLATKNAANSKP